MPEEIFKDELMSEEQLDRVAGGTCLESARDSYFLNALNGSIKRYEVWQMGYEDHNDEIINAWATVGVKLELPESIFVANKYFINGKQVSQEDARKHAMAVTGKYMEEEDWYC